jgi:hypothetical protein
MFQHQKNIFTHDIMVTAAASLLYALTPTVLGFFFSWYGRRTPRNIEEMEALPSATGVAFAKIVAMISDVAPSKSRCRKRLSKASRR